MKKLVSTIVVLILLGSAFAWAQTGDIRGFVYDKESGEPIIFTNVFLKENPATYGAITDENGFYSINKVAEGEYTLMSTYVGYDTTQVKITVKKGKIVNQQLFLTKGNVVLEEIKITAEKEEAQTEVRTSTIKVTPKQIAKIPSVGGEPDLAQYLQVLPGVVFSGDQGGQLYIRGGSQIQTKVLLDGLTIYNPFHSIGLFSIFETEILRNVDVMTGGFSAKYGGRISAVIDVTTKDGNKKRMGGKVGINPFLAKAIVEGPLIKLNDNGASASYIFTAKTSYLDRTSPILYSYIDTAGLPFNFTDFYGKVSFNGNNGSKISFFGYRHDDNVDYKGSSFFGWDAYGAGTNFIVVPGQAKVVMNGRFSFSNYDMRLTEGDGKPRTSSIGGFDFDLNFSYFLPKGDIKYGVNVNGFKTTFEFFNDLGLKIDQNQNTTEIGGFMTYRSMLFNEKLVFEPSVRLSYYASLPAFVFEPRIGMKYNLSKAARLKFSAGIYSQNFISSKSDRDVVNLFTGFLSAPEESLVDINGEEVSDNVQLSNHVIGGIEYDLSKRVSLNLEGYYKNFPQLININRNKLFPQDPDFLVEQGKAYGFDAVVKYDYRRLYLWAVYSLSYVNRDDGEQVYPPHFDRRHNANFLGTYTFGKQKDWEFSARWNLGSGFPFTKTTGFFEELSFSDGLSTDINSQNGELGILYDEELNSGRLPYYHRLDLGLKKFFFFSEHSKLEIAASVTNAYDRDNIFYFDRVRFERVNQLPLMPSLGVSMTF